MLILFLISGFCFFVFQKNPAIGIDCETLTDQTAKDRCEDQKKELEKQAKAYEAIIKIKGQQEKTIQTQLNLLNKEQERNQNDLENTHQKLFTLTERIGNIKRDIKEKEDSIAYRKVVLAGLMQSYYENYQQGVLDIILANKNFSEIFKGIDYTEQTSLKINDILEEINQAKETLQKNRTELEEKKEESEDVKETLQKKNLNLQYTENQKTTLLNQTQEEKEKYEKLLNEIEDEIDNLEASMFAGVDLSNLPPEKKGYFTYPVRPVVISQGYGKTSFSRNYASGKHNGVDFSIKYSNVYAVKNGKVIAIGDNGRYAYGKWVAIEHGDGLTTLYGHFSKISVSKGTTIKEGEKIGTSGNTGFSTGPHLHLSVFSSKTFGTIESTKVKGLMLPVGASVNPMKYF